MDRAGDLGRRKSAPEPAPTRLRHRHCRHQPLRVRMLRILHDRRAWSDLDDLAQIHHRDAMADTLDDRDVVRDEQIGQAHVSLNVHHQIDDLRLDRDVERRYGFIGDQQLRRQRERPCDAQPLPLAAGEFMRKPTRHIGRETDPPEKLADAVVRIRTTEEAMHDHRFGDRAANGLARIEARERILEDHLHASADGAQARAVERAHIVPLEQYSSGIGLDQAQDRAARGRLAATALADQRQRFAGVQRK